MSSKARVLIADNSKDFIWLLVKFLSTQPDVEIVGVAYDGNQTVEMVRQTNPDVLLLDIIMPNMNGFMVLSEIQGKKGLKIITMSALSNTRIIENAMGLGAVSYMIKPFKLNDLYLGIKKCIE